MNVPRNKFSGVMLFLAAMAWGVSGCYQPVEDCLDLQAKNFNVAADNACPDCCIYPEMDLQVVHRMVLPDTTVTFQLNRTYSDDLGQPYRVSQLSYFIQGAEWVLSDGSLLQVQDSILLRSLGADGDTLEDFFRDNLIRMEASNLGINSLGTFRASGQLQTFRLNLGLPPAYVNILPNSAPEGHPLAATDLWKEGLGYAQARISLLPGSDTIPKVIELRSPQPLQTGSLQAARPITLSPGFGTEVVLQVDYASWFRGVDTRTDSPEIMAEKIGRNLPGSFTLVSVVTKL